MDTTQTACVLLANKKEAFERYYAETRRMLSCSVEELEAQVNSRQRIIGEIDGIDAQLRALWARDAALEDAARNRCARGGLTGGYAQVFDAAQQVFTVANRVRSAEQQAMERVREEQERIEQKIRAQSQSVEARASRFYGATNLGMGPPTTGMQLGKA